MPIDEHDYAKIGEAVAHALAPMFEAHQNWLNDLLNTETEGPDEDEVSGLPESAEDEGAEPTERINHEMDTDTYEPGLEGGESMGEHETDEERENYAGGEAGGMTTSIPTMGKRENYSREFGIIDSNFDKTDKQLTWLAGQLQSVQAELRESKTENRRLVYRKQLVDLRSEGYSTLTDAKIAEMLKDVSIDLPADFEAKRVKDIRENYARSTPAAGNRIPVGTIEVGPANDGAMSPADVSKAIAYASKNGIRDFGAALRAVREGK
jgi:hypothetical protein